MLAVRRRGTSDVRLMVRIAQLYYRMHLSQAEIGERLGLSRFQVGRLLDRAVEGFPGFPGAREGARKHLGRTRDVDAAVRSVIDKHVRLAGAQGFLTNLGGLAMLPVTIPANITGLAFLLARQVAPRDLLRAQHPVPPRRPGAVASPLLDPIGRRPNPDPH